MWTYKQNGIFAYEQSIARILRTFIPGAKTEERKQIIMGAGLITRVGAACLCTAIIVSTGGCAQIVLKQYEKRFTAEMGNLSKDDYVRAWGPPRSSTDISTGEVCVWHISHGMRSYNSGSAYGNPYGATYAGNTITREIYDELTLTFDRRNILAGYSVRVQR